MSNDVEYVLVDILTRERMLSYLEVTGQVEVAALELYKWNSQLASEFFQLLGIVEISLRNVIDREMQKLNVTLGNQGE